MSDKEEVVVPEDERSDVPAKKLKKELAACERERKEYLNGWKRAKADAVNERKRQAERMETDRQAALGRYTLVMLPVFDSLRAAMAEEGEACRSGVEQVYTQYVQAFAGLGVDIVDPLGRPFDPHRHQSVGERSVTDDKKSGTVVEVMRVGAEMNGTIIRAAMVYVGSPEKE